MNGKIRVNFFKFSLSKFCMIKKKMNKNGMINAIGLVEIARATDIDNNKMFLKFCLRK